MKIYVCRFIDLLNLESFEIIFKTLEEAREYFTPFEPKYDTTIWTLLEFEIDGEDAKILDFNKIIYINYDENAFRLACDYKIIDKI